MRSLLFLSPIVCLPIVVHQPLGLVQPMLLAAFTPSLAPTPAWKAEALVPSVAGSGVALDASSKSDGRSAYGCTCSELTDAVLTPDERTTVAARMGSLDAALANVSSYAMFFGYGRSGHTLVGALLDGNPSTILANEYNAP